MSHIVIQAHNLGKKYMIGHQAENSPYVTLRDVLVQNARHVWHTTRDLVQGKPFIQGETVEEVWVLKNVSFEICQGEVVGVIGRNGAGKSTLLKILSRITEPTEGQARIRGRVASLLEVGTGFHPELTGRENIFLNGAVLGMTREEIKRKFDEIVAFAEIEKYLDTPVKRYSSGMYVRLAFAVAAHLEPEILLVDEVLAVGDAAFQKKCLEKMEHVAKEGRTVLFVSHNMSSMARLCPRAILLRQGRVSAVGETSEVVRVYLRALNELSATFGAERSGNGTLRFDALVLRTRDSMATGRPIAGEPLEIYLKYSSRESLSNVAFMLTIYNHLGTPVTHCHSDSCGARVRVQKGSGELVCKFARLPFPIGSYRIAIAAYDEGMLLDLVPAAGTFDVECSLFFSGHYVPPAQFCSVLVEHQWVFESREPHDRNQLPCA